MEKDLRFPIGKYETKPFSATQKKDWLNDIQFLPTALESAIKDLDAHQIDTPYRVGGWTVQQLVHHIADSHMNAYIRFKLILTENNPALKPYEENLWAELNDVKTLPINVSITLLHALHIRWFKALEKLKNDDWSRTGFHSGMNKEITLWFLLGMYAWHCRHHVAHITTLRERENW